MDISFEATFSGPLFDGRAPGIVHRYVEDLATTLSQDAVTRIRAYLPTQYMYLGHHGGDPRHNPVPPNAGLLAASILVERETPERALVRGDLVTYGAWIEGDSALNEVVWQGRLRRGLSGRFPGYHTFRIIAQELNAEATGIAYREMIPYISQLNA